jgi:carbamoyltransferase
MKILSLYWGVASTASLFIDNKIAGAVSEERFTRIKNDDAFPEKSISYLLDKFSLTPQDLDGVAIASYIQGLDYTITRRPQFSIDDYVKEQNEYWHPRLYQNQNPTMLEVFSDKIDRNMYPSHYWDDLDKQQSTFPEDREKIVAEYLKIPEEKVCRIDHHLCHAAYTYYASPFRNKKVLAFTIDGFGDDANATISIVHEDGRFERVFTTDQCNIGRIYRYITLVLGMKPNEHEFKVMGLAPYCKPQIYKKPLSVFESTLYVDGIDFKWNEKPTDSYFWFKERLEGCRFDGIAAGLQTWTENLLVEWVENAIDHFGIDTIVLSGGVAMNVKTNGKIAASQKVKEMFVAGTGSDESMALSSGICMAHDLEEKNGNKWDPTSIEYMESLFLGPAAEKADEEKALQDVPDDKYTIISDFTAADIAKYLSKGMVLARCAGPMEFGQRSLGNRSIIADPVDTSIIQRINSMIKNRDFWMPFAPMVLDSYAEKYIVNPKNLKSPHMSIGFDTTEEGWKAMPAGCHPADRSARAQILTERSNKDVYKILQEFQSITGRGAILNTSFNLHGHPIVNTPEEAVFVLLNSDLDGLILNHFLIKKT